MKQIKEHPTLVIEYPDGIKITIYQKITEECLKQLIDDYLVNKNLLLKSKEA